MAMTPPTIVASPAHAPLPFGLFSAVTFRDDSADRWIGGGVSFENIGGEPGPLKALAHDCPPESAGLPRDLDEAGREISYSEPFSVFESYSCSPAGNPLEKAAEVASQRLAIREEYRVEQVIAHGAVGLERSLLDEATALDEADDMATALSQLEAEMAVAYMGQGVIHMSRATASEALIEGVIQTNSGRLRTLMHTPVVAGTGYDFPGFIGTPPLFGYRTEIETMDGTETFDHRTNDLYAVAERSYLIGWAELPVLHATYANVSGGGGGVRGASAYEVAVENGFEGTEEEWLGSLRGPRGNTGNRGPAPEVTWDGTTIVVDGEEGPDLKGADGEDGTDGVDGIVQAVVAGDGIAVDATDPASPIISASAE